MSKNSYGYYNKNFNKENFISKLINILKGEIKNV